MAVIDPEAPADEPTVLASIPCGGRLSSWEDAIEKTWRIGRDCLRTEGVAMGKIKKLVWNDDNQEFVLMDTRAVVGVA
jgi:hypothetical protein